MFIKKCSVVLYALLFTFSLNVHAIKKPHTNVEIATVFFEAIVNKKDFNLAAQYLGNFYIEHDPEGEDGVDGLKHYIEFLQAHYPQSQVTVKRVIADGDYVLFHVHSVLTPGTRGQAIVDIFRLENGKVVLESPKFFRRFL